MLLCCMAFWWLALSLEPEFILCSPFGASRIDTFKLDTCGQLVHILISTRLPYGHDCSLYVHTEPCMPLTVF